MSPQLLQRIGRAVQTRRKSAGFSQEGYAEVIGMHRTYYSAIERGEKNLQIDTLQRVCAGLGCQMWEVLKEAEAPPALPGATLQGD
jgi:transcriptional regulator with XRE-family HTH domain